MVLEQLRRNSEWHNRARRDGWIHSRKAALRLTQPSANFSSEFKKRRELEKLEAISFGDIKRAQKVAMRLSTKTKQSQNGNKRLSKKHRTQDTSGLRQTTLSFSMQPVAPPHTQEPQGENGYESGETQSDLDAWINSIIETKLIEINLGGCCDPACGRLFHWKDLDDSWRLFSLPLASNGSITEGCEFFFSREYYVWLLLRMTSYYVYFILRMLQFKDVLCKIYLNRVIRNSSWDCNNKAFRSRLKKSSPMYFGGFTGETQKELVGKLVLPNALS